MDHCFICQIVGKIEPAFTVYEDGKSLAFLDTFPSAPGHTLVVLKKHGETLFDYSPEELADLMSAVQRVALALEKTFDTAGLSIGINHRELAGIAHLHIHLLPRFPGDGGKIIQSLVYNKPTEDLGNIQKQITRNI